MLAVVVVEAEPPLWPPSFCGSAEDWRPDLLPAFAVDGVVLDCELPADGEVGDAEAFPIGALC